MAIFERGLMPRKRRYVQKVGVGGLLSRIKAEGMEAVDRRSAGYRAAQEWRRSLANDLGGEENLSAQKRTVLELALRSKLMIDSIDVFLLSQESLVNKRRKVLYSVVRERQSLVNSLVNMLATLGLERQEKRVESLPEFLAKYDAEKEHEHHRSDGEPASVREDVPEEGAVPEVGHVG
jgi:hypothetical protein